jgi:orotidine-5'-phosphate decarboxylase
MPLYVFRYDVVVNAASRLIVALDIPHGSDRPIEVADAERVVEMLGDRVSFYKVGWPLYLAPGGHAFPAWLIAQGKRVFLDLKYGDIPHTVRKLVTALAPSGIEFLTIHAATAAVRQAAEARDSARPTALKLLRVTLLTSMDASDLEEMGFALPVPEYVARMARSARAAGCDGVVCSGADAANVRGVVGPDLTIVTPGIRPAGAPADDHKRLATAGDAIRAGADYLVVGRPVLRAADPRDAVARLTEEMQAAFDAR